MGGVSAAVSKTAAGRFHLHGTGVLSVPHLLDADKIGASSFLVPSRLFHDGPGSCAFCTVPFEMLTIVFACCCRV